jgi:hypothetical protein
MDVDWAGFLFYVKFELSNHHVLSSSSHQSLSSSLPHPFYLSLENVKVKQRSTNSFEPKIQLPYNWFVSDKDEAEGDEAKGKETHLFNLGLSTEIRQ